ncbi:glutamine amidotransferase-related protein [Pelagerythrobacter aerophilus]|uniref:Type 1 glutamine amidotransferase n=1 Tax=Pelagerythrobacter aerophilus TaxID=2306995 RepID=A0A418NL13_9SPHN|nr:type 1 glutamine amidotransferase [Pelagerythrobacter aerophilus]RIV80314.1 type 1 glutamine amidotransferase [Pelagerythrobacter aerophilus]
MKLGILKTGAPPPSLKEFGDYPAMFSRLLGEDAYDHRVFDVEAGHLPGNTTDCPAYILTGSASGAYETLPWIADLIAFLQQAKGRVALVGICFGHQIMAQAFGGKVEESPKGWGLGAHTYQVTQAEPWQDGAERITLPASHQDQVVGLPPRSKVIPASDFTPYGMLAYEDQPAISLQLHPEFERNYAAALIELRRGRGVSDEETDRAIASLSEPLDAELAARWIRRFLATNIPG